MLIYAVNHFFKTTILFQPEELMSLLDKLLGSNEYDPQKPDTLSEKSLKLTNWRYAIIGEGTAAFFGNIIKTIVINLA